MFSLDLEPSCPRKFDAVYEKKLRTVAETKGKNNINFATELIFSPHTAELHAYIKSSTSHLPPLYVNTSSKQYKQFMRYARSVLVRVLMSCLPFPLSVALLEYNKLFIMY